MATVIRPPDAMAATSPALCSPSELDVAALKRSVQRQLGDPAAALARCRRRLAPQLDEIMAATARGAAVWPVVPFDAVADGHLAPAAREAVHRRGCVVVTGTVSRGDAERWDDELHETIASLGLVVPPTDVGEPSILPVFWSSA